MVSCCCCCISRDEPAGGPIIHTSSEQPYRKCDARTNGRPSSEPHDVRDAGQSTGRAHVPLWGHERLATGWHATQCVCSTHISYQIILSCLLRVLCKCLYYWILSFLCCASVLIFKRLALHGSLMFKGLLNSTQ